MERKDEGRSTIQKSESNSKSRLETVETGMDPATEGASTEASGAPSSARSSAFNRAAHEIENCFERIKAAVGLGPRVDRSIRYKLIMKRHGTVEEGFRADIDDQIEMEFGSFESAHEFAKANIPHGIIWEIVGPPTLEHGNSKLIPKPSHM